MYLCHHSIRWVLCEACWELCCGRNGSAGPVCRTFASDVQIVSSFYTLVTCFRDQLLFAKGHGTCKHFFVWFGFCLVWFFIFPSRNRCLRNGCQSKLFCGPENVHLLFLYPIKLRLGGAVFPVLSTGEGIKVVSFAFKGAIKTKYNIA